MIQREIENDCFGNLSSLSTYRLRLCRKWDKEKERRGTEEEDKQEEEEDEEEEDEGDEGDEGEENKEEEEEDEKDEKEKKRKEKRKKICLIPKAKIHNTLHILTSSRLVR